MKIFTFFFFTPPNIIEFVVVIPPQLLFGETERYFLNFMKVEIVN